MTKPNDDEILAQLKQLIGGITKVKGDLSRETNLLDDSVLDSLDYMDYIFQIQERFGVKIPDEDLDKRELGNLGNMVGYLQEKTDAAA